MTDGKFLAKPLAGLSAIYRFIGGLSGSSRVELNSPIQLIHDVSRGAELGASLKLALTHSLTTGGAGVNAFVTVEVADIWSGAIGGARDSLRSLGRTIANTDVYLMASRGTLTAATAPNVSLALAAILTPTSPSYISTESSLSGRLLWGANSEVTGNFGAVSGASQPVMWLDAGGVIHNPREFGCVLPALVETIQLRLRDDAVGPVTMSYTHYLMFVPINATAPVSM